jgi:hypothetical protein
MFFVRLSVVCFVFVGLSLFGLCGVRWRSVQPYTGRTLEDIMPYHDCEHVLRVTLVTPWSIPVDAEFRF